MPPGAQTQRLMLYPCPDEGQADSQHYGSAITPMEQGCWVDSSDGTHGGDWTEPSGMPGRRAIWQRSFPMGSLRAARTEGRVPSWEIRPGKCNTGRCGGKAILLALGILNSETGELGSNASPQARPASRELSPPGTVPWPVLPGPLWYLHVVVQVFRSLAHGAVAQHHHVPSFARCM